VHVGPTDWAARSATPIAAGSDIVVLRQDGVVLEVAPA
jgi:membrane protein implicated in regulation of membrane protease activity